MKLALSFVVCAVIRQVAAHAACDVRKKMVQFYRAPEESLNSMAVPVQ